MSDTPAISLTNGHGRSNTMLYALLVANAGKEFPTITELARAYDNRPIIPRPTIASRRNMVRAMQHAGYLTVHHIDDKDRSRYAITFAGIEHLRKHGLGVKS